MIDLHSGLGWAILFVALALPGYIGFWLALSLLRLIRPVRSLSWLQSLLLSAASGTAAVMLLPLVVHALFGPPAH